LRKLKPILKEKEDKVGKMKPWIPPYTLIGILVSLLFSPSLQRQPHAHPIPFHSNLPVVSLNSNNNTHLYTLQLQIGTSSTSLPFLLNTATADTFITSHTNSTSQVSQYEKFYTTYTYPACSHTPAITITDADIVTDRVVLGSKYANFQQIALVSGDGVILQDGASGVLGLAPGRLSNYHFKSVVSTMFEENHIEHDSFSIVLNSHHGNSWMFLGGYDPAFVADGSSMVMNEIVDGVYGKYWAVAVGSFLAGGRGFYTEHSLTMTFSTGVGEVILPEWLYHDLMNEIDVSLSCSEPEKLPDLEFLIGEQRYRLRGQDYSNGNPSDPSENDPYGERDGDDYHPTSSCLRIKAYGNEGEIIMGTVFFERYLGYFDHENHQIGFAYST